MGAATALVVGALLALAVPGPTNAQSPAMQARNSVVLTLDEAITMATSNSRLSRMARETVSEKAAAARGARAELFPRVSFDAIAVTSNANTSLEVPRGSLGTDGLGTPIPNVARRVDQDGASLMFAGLMVSQPLTPLFRIADGSRVARAALGESEAERATTELDLALAAEKLYVGVLMAERRRDAAHAMVVARRAVCADAERAVSAGVSVDARVSEARASVLEAEQALMTASHAAEDARAALNELLGLPLDAAPALAVPPAPSPVDDLASQVTVAARQRPEIAAASAKVDQARHAKDAARTEYIPDVSVFVRQSYQDAVAYVPTNNFSAGVQAKWNVLDFGRRSAQVDQRSATLRLAEESLAHVRDQVALEVEKAYRNATRADQLVGVARQALVARQDAERLTSGQAAAGVVVSAAAQEAAANRTAAESALLEAELGAHVAHAELARAVGARNSRSLAAREP
jgi:outer membrane protein TolC